jgi:hypothetical protein
MQEVLPNLDREQGGKKGDSFLSEFNNVVPYESYVVVLLCEAFLQLHILST